MSKRFETDPNALIIAKFPELVATSREAYDNARSYRDFHVGAAVLAIVENEAHIFSGHNYKLQPSADKICAEVVALKKAEALGTDRVLAVVTAATTIEDEIVEVIGRRQPTLSPCADCVSYICSSPIAKDTKIISIGRNLDIAQVQDVQRLSDPVAFDVVNAWTKAVETYGILARHSDISDDLRRIQLSILSSAQPYEWAPVHD